MPYANPIVLYTFDSNGTNSGSGGATYNITNGTTTISSTDMLKGSGALSVPLNTPAGAGVPIMTYNTGTTGITISFWIKFSSTGTGNRFIYTSKALSVGTGNEYNVMNSLWLDGTNSLAYYAKGAFSPNTISGADFYRDNNWHHMVVVYNGANDTAGKIYIDNNLISSTTTINIGNNVDQKIWIGGCYYGPGNNDYGANGNIDDFRIYNYVADATFVSYLYKLGSNTNIASLSSVAIADLNAAGASVNQLITAGISITNLLNAGYTVSQLIDSGIPFSQIIRSTQWLDLSSTSNVINKTYVNNFIDLSGSMLIRNDGKLTVGGDASFNNVTISGTNFLANDLAITSRLFVGDNVSIFGNMKVGNDLSANGQFSGNFASNLIPTTAIINYSSSGSGSTVITGNVRIAGDVSFNGATVDLSTNTVLQVDDYITFNDGSTMNSFDDLKSRMFDMSASLVTTTTVTGVVQGQRILCSSDGKYVAINMGGLTYGATNTTQSSTGIDISQDYGATFTRKYLNDPANGTTPLYRPYPCLSISLTGQFMICCSYGATGHNVSDNVIGFSNNYGATWSTAYLKDLIGTGTEVMYIRGVAISSDGATMIIDVFRNNNMHMYKTTSKSLSRFTLIRNRGSVFFAENTLKLVQAGGVEYIIAQLLDNSSPGRLVIYYLSSGTNLHTSTINYNGNTDISIPFNAINCILTGPAGQINRVDCREDFVYYPNVTDISTIYSPTTIRMSSVQSPLGKHVLMGLFINSSYNCPDIKDATKLKYSTNGGYTFKNVSGLVSTTFTAIKSVALSDRGHMYVLDDIGSGQVKYVAAKFESLRDVIFKSVVVIGVANVTGSVTTSSDYRIKENVSNLNNTDTIDNLVPIQYNNILTGKHEFGLLAHELQSIYPEFVEGEKDGAEYQRVDYNGLIGVLVKEVQDLKKRVAVLNK